MKKRILMLMLVGCMAFAACGEKEEETTSEDTVSEESPGSEEEEEEDTTPVSEKTEEEKGIDYFMSLGEYKGLELTKNVYDVTDADVDSFVANALGSYPVDGTAVEMEDTVNITYEGKIDGETFDGGSSDSYDLTIGSGTFIDDFEDQLVGMTVGETGEVEVTFPDDYSSEDLQGKDAVFTVTINSISHYLDEPTDEWVAENTDYETVDEYRTWVLSYLEDYYADLAESELFESAWNLVYETATFKEYAKDIMEDCQADQKESYEYYAEMNGMEYDEFMESMGISEDDLLQEAKSNVQIVMIVEYIADKEEIDADSDVYQDKLSELLTESGYADEEAALEDGISEWNMDFVTKYNCVMDLIIDNAEITEEVVTTGVEDTAE